MPAHASREDSKWVQSASVRLVWAQGSVERLVQRSVPGLVPGAVPEAVRGSTHRQPPPLLVASRAAVVTASGQAAMHLAVTTLLSAGDHIVSSRSLYGGTHNLLEYTLSRFGISTTFVDPRVPAAFAAATDVHAPRPLSLVGAVMRQHSA